MNVTPKQYAEALYETLLSASPADQSEILDNFVRLLAEKGQLEAGAAIEAELIRYGQKSQGKISADLTFAKPDLSQNKILEALQRILGKPVEFTKKIDETLVGGVVIETEDQRIDLSVKKQLSNLKKVLSI